MATSALSSEVSCQRGTKLTHLEAERLLIRPESIPQQFCIHGPRHLAHRFPRMPRVGVIAYLLPSTL